jgi:hypothetical protein
MVERGRFATAREHRLPFRLASAERETIVRSFLIDHVLEDEAG